MNEAIPGAAMESLPSRPLKMVEVDKLYESRNAAPITVVPMQSQSSGERRVFVTSIFITSESKQKGFVVAYSNKSEQWYKIFSEDVFETDENEMWAEIEPWLDAHCGLPFEKPDMDFGIEE